MVSPANIWVTSPFPARSATNLTVPVVGVVPIRVTTSLKAVYRSDPPTISAPLLEILFPLEELPKKSLIGEESVRPLIDLNVA